MNTLKLYYALAKPGIVYGNLLTTIAALLFASRWHLSLALFGAAVLGMGFVIASACVCNNYFDREVDRKMSRTRGRALATGKISVRAAFAYAAVLGVAGFCLLIFFVNVLTALLALIGFVWYVFPYTFSKRMTYLSTSIGSVPGAIPMLAGYTAYADTIDLAAAALFFAMVTWQMPHFYAIAIRRGEEYKAAGLPVLPSVRGTFRAKLHMLAYTITFVACALIPVVIHRAGLAYLAAVAAAGTWWLLQTFAGFSASDEKSWAKKTFFLSLVVLLVFSCALAAAPFLP